MKSCKNWDDDPFVMTSYRHLEDLTLKDELETFPVEDRTYLARRSWMKGIDYGELDWGNTEVAQGNPDNFNRGQLNKVAEFRSFTARLGIAAFGGAFLVGPMWLMALDSRKYTGLITTTIFTFAFAVVMARLLRKESTAVVISSTAAYTAVLVVFVGTTSGS